MFNSRLKELRNQKRLSQKDLSKIISVSQQLVGKWETNDSSPNPEKLKQLAEFFSVSVDYLVGYSDYKEQYDPKARIYLSIPDELIKLLQKNDIENLIMKYDTLDYHGKDIINTILQKEYDRIAAQSAIDAYADEENILSLPLSELKASADTGNYLFEESMSEINVVHNKITNKADFAVPVQGRSMEPKYYDGDIVLIQKQPDIDIGEIGLYIVDGNGYLKQKGPDRLISLNKDFPDIFISEFNDIRCCGKVIGILEEKWIRE